MSENGFIIFLSSVVLLLFHIACNFTIELKERVQLVDDWEVGNSDSE